MNSEKGKILAVDGDESVLSSVLASLGVNMKSRRATKIPRPYGPCNH